MKRLRAIANMFLLNIFILCPNETLNRGDAEIFRPNNLLSPQMKSSLMINDGKSVYH